MLGGGSGRKARSCGPWARSYRRGQGGHIGEGKEPSFTRTEPREERSENRRHPPACGGERPFGFGPRGTRSRGGGKGRLSPVPRGGGRGGENSCRAICFCGCLVLEQIRNIVCMARPAAVEKPDGAGEGGDLVPRLGLGCRGQTHQQENVMAGSVNKVILVGNLGKDPEIRRTQDGRPVANLSVPTSHTSRDNATGERRQRTESHRVVIFHHGLCRAAQQYLNEDSKVYLER